MTIRKGGKSMEDKILLMMKNLDITREEAIELIEEDKKIDRMTSMKEIDNDLTDEQKEVVKKARRGSSGSKHKTTTKREKKKDDLKASIIADIISVLNADDVNIINAEREIEFFKNDRKFKIVLSVPRKQKIVIDKLKNICYNKL